MLCYVGMWCCSLLCGFLQKQTATTVDFGFQPSGFRIRTTLSLWISDSKPLDSGFKTKNITGIGIPDSVTVWDKSSRLAFDILQ